MKNRIVNKKSNDSWSVYSPRLSNKQCIICRDSFRLMSYCFPLTFDVWWDSVALLNCYTGQILWLLRAIWYLNKTKTKLTKFISACHKITIFSAFFSVSLSGGLYIYILNLNSAYKWGQNNYPFMKFKVFIKVLLFAF